MGFLQSMGLGQFGRGGQMTIPGGGVGVTANPNDPPPPVPFGFQDDAARQRWQATYDAWQARNGGMDQQQWHQQNPYNPVEHEKQLDLNRPGWRTEFPQTPGAQPPQGMPGGYGGAPMPPMGQGNILRPQVQDPWGRSPNDPQYNQPQGTMATGGDWRAQPGMATGGDWRQPPQMAPWQQPGAFNPTQQRHNAWTMQRGGMMPLGQFGQGGGWGSMLGGLGSAFGLRR